MYRNVVIKHQSASVWNSDTQETAERERERDIDEATVETSQHRL